MTDLRVTRPEISLVRDDNTHGKQSYGWAGEDKIIVFSDGGPCRHGTCRVACTTPMWPQQDHYAAVLNHAERHGYNTSAMILSDKEDEEEAPERPHYCPPDDYMPVDLGPYEE